MRFLLVNNHCISDPTAGVAHSQRTIAQFLVEAGHECRVLTTARFETPVTFTIEQHLSGLGVPIRRERPPLAPRAAAPAPANRPVARFDLRGVPVTLLQTRHNDEERPDWGEALQYLRLCDGLLREQRPDVLIACNGHFMVRHAMQMARERGAAVVFTLRGYGYYDRRHYEPIDHVFTTSRYVSEVYRRKIGLVSTPIESPIEWAQVLAPVESRAFVTFVNPSPHKGVLLFARLADVLGARRPDVPVLVVQSGRGAGHLNRLPGLDFAKYPQIMAAPPVPRPADYFALTRLLLVPSVWYEPFGRVAAEAMINGIPPLVSDRGGLPDTVGGDFAAGGGGFVLPIPACLDGPSPRLPTEDEVRPWFDAVCALWDDPALYEAVSRRARQIAGERYDEATSRRRHVEYLTSLKPGGRLFAEAGAG